MKRLLVGLTLLLACCSAKAQGWDYWYRLNSAFLPLNGGTAANGVGPYSGTPVAGDMIYFNGTNWVSLNAPANGTYSITWTSNVPSWTAGGGSSFTSLTSGTNTTAAMVVGTGASLAASGSGTITATAMNFSGLSSGTNTTGGLVVGTGASMSTSGSGTITATGLTSGAITTSNDGGAVVAQSNSPGTQQGSAGSKNFNLNGVGILETDSLGPATASGLNMQNGTASTGVTTTQWSPAVYFTGTGWNSSGSASQQAQWRIYNAPQTVAGNITSRLFIDRSDNGGAFSNMLTIADNGTMTAAGGLNTSGGVSVTQAGTAISAVTNNAIIATTGTNSGGTGGFSSTYANGASGLITAVRSVTGTCSGATTCNGGTNIPANFTVLAVQVRITTAITGSTTWEIGTANNAAAFCSGITTVAINSTFACGGGSTNANGQENTSAAAPQLTSTVGGNFTAGVVEMIFIGYAHTLPTS